MQIDEKNFLKYIKEQIFNIESDFVEIKNCKYHHATSYDNIINIIEKGILTPRDLRKLGHIDNKAYNLMLDELSHANGVDGVSLYEPSSNENVINGLEINNVDILLDKLLLARRVTTNYCNEAVSFESIKPSMFKAIDIRLLDYMISADYKMKYKQNKEEANQCIINMYNNISKIAQAMIDKNMDIPFREMSKGHEKIIIKEKAIKLPKIDIKY